MAEGKPTTVISGVAFGMLLGNTLRKKLRDELDNRRTLIGGTDQSTPMYQASLNCLEADLLQAVASVLQQHIDELTHRMEEERARKMGEQ